MTISIYFPSGLKEQKMMFTLNEKNDMTVCNDVVDVCDCIYVNKRSKGKVNRNLYVID